MSKVRTMIAEGRPTILVGKGFNWPALGRRLIRAIYKSFWPAAAALVVIYGGLRMIASQATQSGYPFLNLLALLAIVAIAILVGLYANVLYAAYLYNKRGTASAPVPPRLLANHLRSGNVVVVQTWELAWLNAKISKG